MLRLLIALILSWNTLSALELIVMRHGEAENNVKNIYNSNPASPNYTRVDLTENGKKQVEATAKELKAQGLSNASIEAVYVSPLPRTVETANILIQEGLFSKDKLHIDPRLIEVQMGDLEGKTMLKTWDTSDAKKYHTETDEEIQKRMQQFYDSILTKHPQGTIIVITHGIPAQKLMSLVEPNPPKLSTGEAKILPLTPSKQLQEQK